MRRLRGKATHKNNKTAVTTKFVFSYNFNETLIISRSNALSLGTFVGAKHVRIESKSEIKRVFQGSTYLYLNL